MQAAAVAVRVGSGRVSRTLDILEEGALWCGDRVPSSSCRSYKRVLCRCMSTPLHVFHVHEIQHGNEQPTARGTRWGRSTSTTWKGCGRW